MRRWFFFPPELLPELVQVEGGGISSIVVISIHVQNLEAVDGEEAAEDALLEPRAQHDHVVLLVHGGAGWLAAAIAGEQSGSRWEQEQEQAEEWS